MTISSWPLVLDEVSGVPWSNTIAVNTQPGQGALTAVIADVLFPVSATGISGTLTATFSPITLSASAKVAIQGSLSATLDAITLSANGSGSVGINGSLTATIDPITLSSAAKLAIAGLLNQTIAAITLSGSAKVAIQGTLNQTIAAITLSANGTLIAVGSGSLNVTIDPITLSSSATITQPATTDRGRYDHIEIRRLEQRNTKPLRSWTEDVERIVAEAIEPERQDDRPKTRKVKAEVVKEVIEAVGSGLLATVQPTPEIRQAVSLALNDNADTSALYARIAQAIQSQLDEQDDEDVITLLLAA